MIAFFSMLLLESWPLSWVEGWIKKAKAPWKWPLKNAFKKPSQHFNCLYYVLYFVINNLKRKMFSDVWNTFWVVSSPEIKPTNLTQVDPNVWPYEPSLTQDVPNLDPVGPTQNWVQLGLLCLAWTQIWGQLNTTHFFTLRAQHGWTPKIGSKFGFNP